MSADILVFDRGRRRVPCPGCDTETALGDLKPIEFDGDTLLVCDACRQHSGGVLLLEVLQGTRELPD